MHQKDRLSSAARWMTVALAMLFPLAAHALGLGKLTVRSALNEPLNAEIEISSITEKELKGLQVGLAPRSDFDQAGIERLPFLSEVKFTISKRADGNYFVQLRTDRQIEEPFLHLLLAIEWPGGRMVREYTALIDPPTQAFGRPSGIDVPPAAPSAPVIAAAQPSAQPRPEPIVKEEPKPAPVPVEKPEVQAAPTSPPPADVAPAQPPPASAPAFVTPPPPAPSERRTTAERPTPPEPKVVTAPASTPSVASGWAMEGGYQVKWGDTAWRIAEQLRTSDAQTIEQLILALYRTNPQAFFGNNVNNLKSGQILKIPEGTHIESITPVQARTEFRAQYDAWQEYKIKLAGASSAIKVVDSEPKPKPQPVAKAQPPKPEPKEPVVAKKEPEVKKEPEAKKETDKLAKAPPVKGAQQDELLKIVRSTLQGEKTTPDKKPAEGETAKDRGVKEQKALAERVTTLEESLVSKQAETKEIGDKVAQVRAQLKREARLIQIEQQDLAAAQARTKAVEPIAKVEPPKPEPTPAPKAAEPAPQVEPPKPVEKPVAVAPKPLPTPPAEKPPTVAAPKKPAAPAPVEGKGFLDELLDELMESAQSALSEDNFMPVVIGVVGLASVIIGFVYIRRRRKSIAEFEESILQSEGIPGTTGEPSMTTDTSGQVVSSGDTSFLSDFSQGGMGNIHTDEVDPIAEAEVYLAYGRDETAEEILKEAIVKNPAREELKLKLLEIYANRSDVRAFETLAEEMYAVMGGRPSKNWPRVEELGRKLNPNNPMFKGGAAPAGAKVAAASAASFTDTAKMKAAAPAAPSTALLTDTQTGLAAPTVASDFDFDLGAATPAAAKADQGLDFDMGNGAGTKTAVAASLDFASATASSEGGLDMDIGQAAGNAVDFDFGEKEEVVSAAPQTDVALAPAPGGGEPVTSDATESPQWDETATKLDLARAYIDMGDSEGARSILDEVMAEGNDQQKKQAKELAAQLA